MLQTAMPSNVDAKIIMKARAVLMLSVTLARKKSIHAKTLIIVSKFVNIPMIDIASQYRTF